MGGVKIAVTRHAIDMYRQRFERSLQAMEDLPREERHRIHEEIRLCVETGLSDGRISKERPKGFALYAGHNKKQRRELPPGQMFVSCSEDHGFIVAQDPDETYVVVTTLSRTGVSR